MKLYELGGVKFIVHDGELYVHESEVFKHPAIQEETEEKEEKDEPAPPARKKPRKAQAKGHPSYDRF